MVVFAWCVVIGSLVAALVCLGMISRGDTIARRLVDDLISRPKVNAMRREIVAMQKALEAEAERNAALARTLDAIQALPTTGERRRFA